MCTYYKNRFDTLGEFGNEDCNKSASTLVKLVKQSPNEDLNGPKKQPSLFPIYC